MYKNFKIIHDLSNNSTIFRFECIICSKKVDITVSNDDLLKLDMWMKGQCDIREALPNHTSDDHEMFISGFCKECWDREFFDD